MLINVALKKDHAKAYRSAVTLLSMREYSRIDLQKRLIQKGYSMEVVHSVLDELSSQGLQSDMRFVESYIRARLRRGYGIQRILRELEQRGIQRDFMLPFEEQVSQTWQQHILEVWKKKFQGKQPTLLSEKVKQFRFLQYRGFTVDQIQWVWQCGKPIKSVQHS